MPTKSPSSARLLTEFATTMLAQREVAPRAQLTADYVAQILPRAAVVVYVILDQAAPTWTPKASAGDVEVGIEHVDFDSGTLGAAAENGSVCVFSASELAREDYAHLDVRRTVVSLAYVPLGSDDALHGMIEIV